MIWKTRIYEFLGIFWNLYASIYLFWYANECYKNQEYTYVTINYLLGWVNLFCLIYLIVSIVYFENKIKMLDTRLNKIKEKQSNESITNE
jgi:hypothetical protein